MATTAEHAADRVRHERTPGSQETAALARAARLEAMLGDPYDPANPHGLKALFAADERRETPARTEALLAAAGLGAEFVPAQYGGRLTRADLLARVLRPVFRRDAALGFGCGITSLFATSAVWTAGTEHQRRSTADLLLDQGRATTVPHQPTHANALLRGEITARPTTGGYLLSGSKDLILNAARADIHVVYARTDPARTPRSHSVLLLDRDQLTDGTRHRPRTETTGMRGCLFSGLELTDLTVPDDTLVGRPGEGTALALRTSQITRTLTAGTLVAAADTVLHSAVHAATTGPSRPVARTWHTTLTGVFADLLACDSMATVALRALSLLPDRSSLPAAAVMYVAPALLRENLEELTPVLGSRGYARHDPPYGALDKLTRDLPMAGLGHAGTAACQAVIVPQLRTLAERSWFREPEPPPELFRTGADLPALDHRLLTIAGGGDFLAATLVGSAARLADQRAAGSRPALLAHLAAELVTELHALRTACRALPATTPGTPPAPASYRLSDRYAHVLAAAAVLGVWEGQDGSDPFLTAPAWAILALSRIGRRLGIQVPEPPQDCTQTVLQELVRRSRAGLSCDLYATAQR